MKYSELENRVIESLISQYGKAESRSIQRFLFECFTGIEPAAYLLIRQNEAGEVFEERILHAISQLVECVPVQYVTGVTWFCGFKFEVRPGVLIPRPETEELVLIIVQKYSQSQGLKVLDIGTGSGAIAISLDLMLNQAVVSAIDISPAALEIARENAASNKSGVSVSETDILNRSAWDRFGKFDLIVSNPPYVKLSEKSFMRRNVLEYEPEIALFVNDEDPLLFYRAIAEFAFWHLEAGGELWFEINESEGSDISVLLNSAGFEKIQIYPDYNNKPRMLSASQPSNN
ncbi:MAG: peptide chain release factor N(5)-glutamine methyltransferase [Lentimicrobium sp.]